MGFHFLLQDIFLTQGSNLHLLHRQAESLSLSHPGILFFEFGSPDSDDRGAPASLHGAEDSVAGGVSLPFCFPCRVPRDKKALRERLEQPGTL